MKPSKGALDVLIGQTSTDDGKTKGKCFLPPQYFIKKHQYVVIAIVSKGTISFLDEEASKKVWESSNENKSYVDDSAPDRGASAWDRWRPPCARRGNDNDIKRPTMSRRETGGIDPSYRGIVVKYYVIPQVLMGVYATHGLHENIHFSVLPELMEKFIEEVRANGIPLQVLSPTEHYKDEHVEFWSPDCPRWDDVKDHFENLDWYNNARLFDGKKNDRGNYQETGGTCTQDFHTRITSMFVSKPSVKRATTEKDMISDMVHMSKIGAESGWIKTPAQRETMNSSGASRERVRTLLFLRIFHPECYTEAMSDTATRAGFDYISTHTDDHNGRWKNHQYVVVAFIHMVVDPLGTSPVHARFSKIAYSRKSVEDFIHRYYCVHEASRDLREFLQFLKEVDPSRLFYDEDIIKSGQLQGREMVAYCFYYQLPNIDKRMFLSAFIDPVHRYAEHFCLPFEAIVDVSYCIGWCTEPTKLALILDDWISKNYCPTHQMLCFSIVEAAKERFGTLATGPFPRCGIFANSGINKRRMELHHIRVCELIKEAGEERADNRYGNKDGYKMFISETVGCKDIKNIGEFSGQNWAQCLISLRLIDRPEWSNHAFVSGGTKNYSRFKQRYGIDGPNCLHSTFESVTAVTKMSSFLVENIFCEMYKSYTGSNPSQARDCFHSRSRFYMIKYDKTADNYDVFYVANGCQQGRVGVTRDWFRRYSQYGGRMIQANEDIRTVYKIRRSALVRNEDMNNEDLFISGGSHCKLHPMAAFLDQHCFLRDDVNSVSLHTNSINNSLRCDGIQQNRHHLHVDFESIAAAGRRVSNEVCCKEITRCKLAKMDFPLPAKERYQTVMDKLLQEIRGEDLPADVSRDSTLKHPRLGLHCLKGAHELTIDQWNRCETQIVATTPDSCWVNYACALYAGGFVQGCALQEQNRFAVGKFCVPPEHDALICWLVGHLKKRRYISDDLPPSNFISQLSQKHEIEYTVVAPPCIPPASVIWSRDVLRQKDGDAPNPELSYTNIPRASMDSDMSSKVVIPRNSSPEGGANTDVMECSHERHVLTLPAHRYRTRYQKRKAVTKKPASGRDSMRESSTRYQYSYLDKETSDAKRTESIPMPGIVAEKFALLKKEDEYDWPALKHWEMRFENYQQNVDTAETEKLLDLALANKGISPDPIHSTTLDDILEAAFCAEKTSLEVEQTTQNTFLAAEVFAEESSTRDSVATCTSLSATPIFRFWPAHSESTELTISRNVNVVYQNPESDLVMESEHLCRDMGIAQNGAPSWVKQPSADTAFRATTRKRTPGRKKNVSNKRKKCESQNNPLNDVSGEKEERNIVSQVPQLSDETIRKLAAEIVKLTNNGQV